MSTEIVPREEKQNQVVHLPHDASTFQTHLMMADMFAKSTIVPADYQGNASNCFIAIDMAARMKMSPIAVMQSLYIVYGKPAWDAKFMISCVNFCGRFSAIQYEETGEGDDRGCVAWATEKETGEVLRSTRVTIAMAKQEGWFSKKGSKWQTMPGLMLRYRSATFFARTYCPELTLGLYMADEIEDITPESRREPQRQIAKPKPAKIQQPEPEPKTTPAQDEAIAGILENIKTADSQERLKEVGKHVNNIIDEFEITNGRCEMLRKKYAERLRELKKDEVLQKCLTQIQTASSLDMLKKVSLEILEVAKKHSFDESQMLELNEAELERREILKEAANQGTENF